MAPGRYTAAGSEREFQPGSRGRVLRNFLGITKVRAMEDAETQALAAAQRAARTIYGPNRRFTPADIRRLHRMWLGSIYPWAGNYRTVNLDKDGLQFAHAPLIPRLMANLGKDTLRRHTPCRDAAHATVARSLAEVHAQLILIHPFRDGNGRLARLVSALMAAQAGVNSLRLSALAGTGRRTYMQAIHAAMARDYAPLESLFCCALDGPWRSASRHNSCKMVNLIELTDLTNMARVPTAEPAMETIAAAAAKTNFGALLDKAQRAPIMISKNGRAVAVVMSAEAYEEQQQLKVEVLRREIQKGLDDVKRGRIVSRARALAMVDKELRKK